MSRFVITADWDNNAPHLTPKARADLWNSIPPYQRDARTKGIPQLGAGVIYPLADDDILCDAFTIPDHWLRGYALDVGWKRTAGIWRAKDPDTGKSYLYDEHYGAEDAPEIHSAAIRRRGVWINGMFDPAARGRKQDDGERMMSLYDKAIYTDGDDKAPTRLPNAGTVMLANNAVETGIYDMLMAFRDGTLKVMRQRCPNFMAERRLYRRDEKGRIVKSFDHACDAARYNYASGDSWLLQLPKRTSKVVDPFERFLQGGGGNSNHWSGN